VVIILFLSPLARYVPLAVLAAILFVIAWNMSEAQHFVRMVRRAPRADVAILVVTFMLTVFTDLVIAVNIGIIVATFQFMRRMASSVEVQELTESDLQADLVKLGIAKLPPGVLVYAIDGPFFFGAVENFERALAFTHTEPRILLIRLRRVPYMDITGLQTLEEVIQALMKRGVTVVLTEANRRVHGKLERVGVIGMIGKYNYYHDFAAALAYCGGISDSSATTQAPPGSHAGRA
jgi:SulP family sulfate permease